MASQRSPRAKITRPKAAKVVERERLYRLLDKSRGQQALWVLGPAGAGKTTLVSSYIESRQPGCLWYQLDQGDSDVATFFYYLAQACSTNGLASPRPLPALTPEYFQDIAAYSRMFFEELFSRSSSDLVLVLDNYQEVVPDSLLHDVVRQCLEVTPEHVRLIALSRQEPPPALARARANSVLDILGWEEIRLRREESSALAAMLGGKSLSRRAVETLHQKTNGWIAGMILMLKRPEIKDLETRHLDTYTPSEIFDYFGNEIFSNAPSDIQRFLMTTAVLPEMAPSRVAELTGRIDALEILERLNKEHYFTDKRIGTEIAYVYHPLFREFLLSRADRLLLPEELSKVKLQAARLLESGAHRDEAFALYRDLGATQDMVRLVLTSAPDMLAYSRQQRLLEWIKGIPEPDRESMPWLLYWQATCLLAMNPPEALELFERAWTGFDSHGDLPGVLLSLSGVINAIIFALQPGGQLDPWIDRLDSASILATDLPLEVESQVIVSMLNALVFRQPDRQSFNRWEQRARTMLDMDLPLNQKVQVVIPLMMYEVNRGEFAVAGHYLDSYAPRMDKEHVSPLPRAIFECQALLYCWSSGDFERSREHFDRAGRIFEDTGVRMLEPFVLCHEAIVAMCTGDMARTAASVARLETAYQTTGAWGVGLYYLVRTWHALLVTDPPRAEYFSRKSMDYALQAGTIHQFASAYLARAVALRVQGEYEEAAGMLAQALGWCERLPTRHIEFGCRLAQAEFALDKGNRETAVQRLAEALPLGREKGYWNTLLWRPEPMARLCVLALEEDIETGYARELIRRRDLTPDPPPRHLEQWPWELRVYTLGRFDILRRDTLLTFKGKVQKRPLHLLQGVIALGGQNVPEIELLDMFWPDLDGSDAHNAFTMALHRLRKTLGAKDVLNLSAGKLSLDPSRVWSDVWAIEELLSVAEGSWSSGQAMQADFFTRKALDLAQGPFLPEVSDSWSISVRERIRYRLLRALHNLTSLHEEQQQWSDAEAVCRRALEIDPLREDFCRGLMRSCLEQGRKAEALAVFRSCRERLGAELGVAPDRRTQTLYRHIADKG